MSSNTRDARLKAFYSRNSAYTGLFYVAVKTTGIFCRIGCPARPPKPENVFFFDTLKDALDAGFRPCKVCKPLESGGDVPAAIRDLLRELHATPHARIRDGELRRRGIAPETVRRWFQKRHGITFQAYQRYLKIAKAVERLNSGDKVSEVAFESYDSLSGFQDSFKHTLGVSPKASVGKVVVAITRLQTPLGLMMAGAIGNELCLLEFCDRRMLAAELDEIQKRLKTLLMPGHDPVFDTLHVQLDEYFRGERSEFSIPLRLLGSPFQITVWQSLLTIPCGATRSYQEQSRLIGRPDAIRAVASANGQNRIAILVPCHRVIGKDGSLTGYGGGLSRKQWLLNHEAQVIGGSQSP